MCQVFTPILPSMVSRMALQQRIGLHWKRGHQPTNFYLFHALGLDILTLAFAHGMKEIQEVARKGHTMVWIVLEAKAMILIINTRGGGATFYFCYVLFSDRSFGAALALNDVRVSMALTPVFVALS